MQYKISDVMCQIIDISVLRSPESPKNGFENYVIFCHRSYVLCFTSPHTRTKFNQVWVLAISQVFFPFIFFNNSKLMGSSHKKGNYDFSQNRL